MISIMRSLRLICVVGLAFGLWAKPVAAITVTGVLHNDTRWTKTMSPVTLSGDVTVSKGVTLTIDPGVELRAATSDTQKSGADPAKVELIIQGTLDAKGSSTELITFTSTQASKDAWYGIIIDTGGKATIQFAQIRYARYGITNRATVELSDLTVDNCNNYGIYAISGTTTLMRGKISLNQTGVYATGGNVRVEYSQIYRNTSYGVYAGYSASNASIWLDHNTIAHNSSYGIYINRSSSSSGAATIQNSIVVRNSNTSSSGYEVYSENYGPTCTNNLFWDTAGGITYTRYSPTCSATISHNPLFVDEAKNDFSIYDRSPARKADNTGGDLGALAWAGDKTNILHGYLFNDLLLPSGIYVLTGDLVVTKGVKLTLVPGTIIHAKSTDDMAGGVNGSKAELIVDGELISEGDATQQIEFRPETSTTTKGVWYGITIMAGGSAKISHTSIRGGIYCIENYGTLNLDSSEIAYCNNYGVYPRSGTATITESKIFQNQTGIYAIGGVNRVSYSQIYRNTSYGVYAGYSASNASIWLDHNTIAHNSSYGIYINRSSSSTGAATIQNNIVVRNSNTSSSGYEVYSENYGPTCTNNLFWDTAGGITYTRYSPTCSANISYNPLFVDENKDDYRLYNRSPARKADSKGEDLGALAWTVHVTNVLHGVLFTDLTLPAGNHALTGDLIVGKGVTLTVAPGAVIQAKSSDDMYGGQVASKIELIVEGKMIAQGSASQPVEFRAEASTTAKGLWQGIRVETGGILEMQRAIVLGATYGIENFGSANLSDLEIIHSSNYGIYPRAGTTTVVRGKLSLNQTGIYMAGGTVRVSYCQIYRNTSYGVYAGYSVSNDTIWLDHNTIAYNNSYGIYINRSSSGAGTATIQNSIVVRNSNTSSSGYEVYSENYGPTCTNNLFWDTAGGITYTRYSPTCQALVSSNPLFVDEAKDNYSLQTTSPARGRANDNSDLGALPFLPTLTQIVVSPSPSQVEVTKTAKFTAQGLDSVGSVVSGLTFTWKVVNGGGTIDQNGVFTAGTKTGTFTSTVEATSGSVQGYATVIVTPGPTAKVEISPNPTKVKAGDKITLTSTVRDQYGNQISGKVAQWSLISGVGMIDQSGVLTAGTKAGLYANGVSAVVDNVTGQANVEILPNNLAKIIVSPNPGKVLANNILQFAAEGQDTYGNTIANVSFTWKVVNGGGTIDPTGLLTSGAKEGTFTDTVEVSSGSIKGYATLIVGASAPKVASVEITPNKASLKPGEQINFRAVAKDSQGSTVSGESFSWSLPKGGGAFTTSSGLRTIAYFTAGNAPGNFVIVAEASGVQGSANIEIIDPGAGTLARIEVSPAQATIEIGKTQQFTAKGYDANNQSVANLSVTWSVSGGGKIDGNGLFSADKIAGSFTVTATSGSISGKATVQIQDPNAGKLNRIEVSPSKVSLRVKATQQFTAQGYDANNQTVSNFTVSWSVSSGGTIDSKGLFTAGSVAGTHTITATSSSITGTATVQISAGQAPSIPQPKSPPDKSEVKTDKPTLEITNSIDPDGDPITYEFEVGSDALFTQTVANGKTPETAGSTRWQVSQPLQEDTTYFWRARSSDGLLTSSWSVVWSFRVNVVNSPPTAPKLSSPVDGGQVAYLQPTLEVTNASDPENQPLVYLFELANDKAMSSVIVRSPNIPEGKAGATQWQVSTQLKDGNTYYWQAWAIDDQGLAGPKMPVASFSVSLANKPPSPPQPRSPKDGETVTLLRPTFEIVNAIDPDGDPVSLDIEIDIKQTFDTPDKISKSSLPQNQSGITTWIPDSDLKENYTHFWRVRASDGKTTTVWVFGGEFKVNSQNEPPTTPQPRLPADKTILLDNYTTLEVTNATDPDGDNLTYHFQLAENNSFNPIAKEQRDLPEGKGTTRWKIDNLSKGQTYYWRVRANDGQIDGPWSELFSFSIKFDPLEPMSEPMPEPMPEPIPDASEGEQTHSEPHVPVDESATTPDTSTHSCPVEDLVKKCDADGKNCKLVCPDQLCEPHERIQQCDANGKNCKMICPTAQGGCACSNISSFPRHAPFIFLIWLFALVFIRNIRK